MSYKNNIVPDIEKLGALTHQLPPQLLQYFAKNGMSTILDDYWHFVYPDDLKAYLEKGYFRAANAVPFAISAFGEILAWEENRYVSLLDFQKGSVKIIASGFDFILKDLCDKAFANKHFDMVLFEAAKQKFGTLKCGECYGLVPILALGGQADVNHMEVCQCREYLELILQATGGIQN